MWLKWRLVRTGLSDKFEYVHISDRVASDILALGDDEDAVAEQEEVIKFPNFTVARWTRLEWEILSYPPPNVLRRKIETLEYCIQKYKKEIDEHKKLLEEIQFFNKSS